MLPTCTTATEESSVTIHSPTHGPRGRAPRGADEGPAALPLDPPPPPPARHQGAGDDDEQHRRRREHQRATEWEDAGLTRSDPLLDPGPQIRRRLDAARQPARRVEKVLVLGVVLVVVHRSSISRNNRRARNNCALDVPSAIPASTAISSWRYPSMSCSTKTSRAPSGSAAMARSRSIPNPAVAARPGRSRAAGSSAGRTRCSRRWVARRSASTTFTASRCSHEEKALSPRNVPRRCQARTKTSCVRSSASAALPVSRRHSAYSRPAHSRYSPSNAASSPACARRTTSVTPGEERGGGGTAWGEAGGRSSVRMKWLRVAAACSLLRCQLKEDRWNKVREAGCRESGPAAAARAHAEP